MPNLAEARDHLHRNILARPPSLGGRSDPFGNPPEENALFHDDLYPAADESAELLPVPLGVPLPELEQPSWGKERLQM